MAGLFDKETYEKKYSKSIVILLIVLLALVGCQAEKDSYAGTYLGERNSTLILKENGNCTYGENDDTGVGNGSWEITNDKIIVMVDNLSYPIYAILNEENRDTLYFESKSSRWRAERFKKQ